MASFYQSYIYQTDPAILAFSEGNISTASATVTSQYVGLNSDSKFTVPAGLFVADTGSVIRFLPRTKNTTAVSSASPTFTASPYNIFIPNDVLYVLEPYVVITITSSAATNTQTVTINGRTVTATVTSSNTTQSAIEIAAAINNDVYVGNLVRAIPLVSAVYVFIKDGKTLYPVTIGGTVVSSLSASSSVTTANAAYNTTAIGTISFINNVSGLITLTANSTVSLPIGTNLHVPVKKILGLHVHAIDYSIFNQHSCNCYSIASGVRIQYLPYFDDTLRHVFPRLNFDYTF